MRKLKFEDIHGAIINRKLKTDREDNDRQKKDKKNKQWSIHRTTHKNKD